MIPSDPLKIVVVEDDSLVRDTLKILLGPNLHLSFLELPDLLESNLREADGILLDLCGPRDPTGRENIARISELKSRFPHSEIIVQSGLSEVEIMRRCVQNGASRYLLKDHLADEVPLLIEKLREIRALRNELDRTLIGVSPVVRSLKRQLLDLRLETSMDVLVEGETGSGKELCARALHGGGPFVAVNVSAVPAELFEAEFFGAERGAYTGSTQTRVGHFESAGAGVLFLDEIQSLSLPLQSKLLRVLETRTFMRVGSSMERALRARIVSASNVNLREYVQKGLFREDLYYRLSAITLQVPPLRVRSEDIPGLAEVFLAEVETARTKRFSADGLKSLQLDYDWPGNVRELRAVVRSLAVTVPFPVLDRPEIRKALGLEGTEAPKRPDPLGGEVAPEFRVDPSLGFDENIARLEKHLLSNALKGRDSNGAREFLRLSRSRFYEKLKHYGLGRNS